jgi:hypothetical protein
MITLALCFFKNILFLGHKWRNPLQRENTTRSQGRTPTPKQTKKSALKTKTNWWLVAPLDLRPSLAQIAWWGTSLLFKKLFRSSSSSSDLGPLSLLCLLFPFCWVCVSFYEVCQGFIILGPAFFSQRLVPGYAATQAYHSLQRPSFSHDSSTIFEHKHCFF